MTIRVEDNVADLGAETTGPRSSSSVTCSEASGPRRNASPAQRCAEPSETTPHNKERENDEYT